MTYNLFEVYLIGLLLLFYICIFISMVMQNAIKKTVHTITKWVKSAERIHNLSPQHLNVTAYMN